MKSSSPATEELYRVILRLNTLDEAKRFFRDLLTEEEIEEFSKRWLAARLLDQNISYINIQKATGLSSTTIARISRWLRGSVGGYRLMLERFHHTCPSSEKRSV